uniref:Telomeric repeat-binding factor 2-interacting protein 1 n=1 Tax=Timema shepardi TaxID=629360 RepID=A0A7R9AZ37_TIMSH|nr:unnamed protein product [Timema shepardi]
MLILNKQSQFKPEFNFRDILEKKITWSEARPFIEHYSYFFHGTAQANRNAQRPMSLNDTALANKNAQRPMSLNDTALANKNAQRPLSLNDTTLANRNAQRPMSLNDTTLANKNAQRPMSLNDTALANKNAQRPLSLNDTVLANRNAQRPMSLNDTTLANKNAQRPMSLNDTTLANKNAQRPMSLNDTALANKNAQRPMSLNDTAQTSMNVQRPMSVMAEDNLLFNPGLLELIGTGTLPIFEPSTSSSSSIQSIEGLTTGPPTRISFIGLVRLLLHWSGPAPLTLVSSGSSYIGSSYIGLVRLLLHWSGPAPLTLVRSGSSYIGPVRLLLQWSGPAPLTLVRTSRSYTLKEEQTILKYIADNNMYDKVKGRQMWQLMASSRGINKRTWQSLKEHYIKSMIPRIDSFDLTKKEKNKFMWNMMTLNQAKSSTANLSSLTVQPKNLATSMFTEDMADMVALHSKTGKETRFFSVHMKPNRLTVEFCLCKAAHNLELGSELNRGFGPNILLSDIEINPTGSLQGRTWIVGSSRSPGSLTVNRSRCPQLLIADT